MIRNLTEAEWQALCGAIAHQDVVWEQDGDAFGHSATTARKTLQRALDKCRQLAPEVVA
jgi:surface antigen